MFTGYFPSELTVVHSFFRPPRYAPYDYEHFGFRGSKEENKHFLPRPLIISHQGGDPFDSIKPHDFLPAVQVRWTILALSSNIFTGQRTSI